MQVASSIQIPKRVDPKRKLLVKQLQNDIKNIKKQNISTPKRKPSQDHDEYQNMDTLKKKQHMDQLGIKNGKQNHRTQKQNDRFFAHNKSHEIPIKPPMNPQINSQIQHEELAQNDRTVRKEDTFALPNAPLLFPMMLDQSIPNLKDPNLGIFTDKERLLITIQQKLDSYLLFVKENRKKKKGQFFSLIKKSFLQNQRIFLEFSHIKKILFVDSDLYKVQKYGEGASIDCLIDIKLKCNEPDTKTLQMELRQRKNTFPNKLLAVKEELKDTTGQEKVQIPEVKFEFEATVQASKTVMKKSLKNILDGEMMNKKKIDKFFVLQGKDSTEYQMAKKILLTGIKRVETIIQKETQIDLKLFENKIKQLKQLNQKQIESIIQEVNFIYKSRSVTNLLFDQLIEALSKKMILSLEVLRKCINVFIEVGPKISNSRPFLKSINHKSGRIIQMERSSMDEFRNMIVKNEEWMNNFKFDLEMSNDQVRKKMEVERIRVFQEVREIAFDEVVSQNQVLKPKLSETSQNEKIDFSQVRPFVASPVKQKIDANSSQQESESQNEQIGVPKAQYDETLKIIRQERQNAMKARREIRMVADKKIRQLMGEKSPENKKKAYKKKEKLQNKKNEIPQEEKSELSQERNEGFPQEKKDEFSENNLPQIQYKEEFKSTLSNSDELLFHEDEPIKEQNNEL